MPTRSCLVILHNETPHVLTRVEEDLEDGEWGRRGRQRPPATVQPGATVEMGSDSSGIAIGTEASVRYRIETAGDAFAYLHWNNPFLGSNSYHQHTDAGHHAFRVGGKGNNATVHFTVRTSELRTTGFLPSQHGFRFPNSFGERPYSLPPLRGSFLDRKYGNAKDGLCGGMVFAARDYFESHWGVPPSTAPPVGEEDPFFLYLVDRLFATFSANSISLLLKLMNPLLPDTDEEAFGLLDLAGPTVLAIRRLLGSRAQVIVDTEWPLIRADIDAGRPSPVVLCMVRSLLPFDLGLNHQVLAYAYQARGDDIELRVYDPNTDPNNPASNPDDVSLRFSVRTRSEPIVITHNVQVTDDDGVSRRPINCFARMDYEHRQPGGPQGEWPGTSGQYPPQVLLAVSSDTGTGDILESGTRSFLIGGGECGSRELPFERIWQEVVTSAVATPISYANPRVSWRVNGAPVPDGGPNRWTVQARTSVRSDPEAEADADAEEVPDDVDGRVTIGTTLDGMTLTVRNDRGDGSYHLRLDAECAEGGDAGTTSRASVDLRVLGERLDVPGRAAAEAACVMERLRTLQQALPTEEELLASIMASILAQANRPPDPLWDPDPLLADAGWAEFLDDPQRDEVLLAVDDGSADLASAALESALTGQAEVVGSREDEATVAGAETEIGAEWTEEAWVEADPLDTGLADVDLAEAEVMATDVAEAKPAEAVVAEPAVAEAEASEADVADVESTRDGPG